MEHTSRLGSAFCLRVHADYRCRHAGACCTAGWTIPIERPAYERVRVHFGEQARRRLFAAGGPLPQGAAAVLGLQSSGACVFFEQGRGNLCAVHRELGPASLPAACRHFPRIVLHDARGTLISLSHFCPTVAGLLRSPHARAFEVVHAPGSLALESDVGDEGPARLEGLNARDALPPLLRPGMLTDLEGYDAWERRAIGVLGRSDLTAAQALAILTTATRSVQSWRPGAISLRETVEREFDVASAGKPDENLDASDHDELRVRLALSSIPPGLPRPPLDEGWRARWHTVAGRVDRASVSAWSDEVDGAVRAYLAARLFGNWIAYHGQGLHAIVEYLRVALALVRMEVVRAEVVRPIRSRMEGLRHDAHESPSSPWQTVTEAVRSADLLLVHLADTRTLSRLLGASRLE